MNGRVLLRQLPGALQGAAVPMLIVLILGMMIVPIPPFALDVLFTFNIGLSLAILFAGLYTSRVLDFSSFPSVLLVATILRLALNVASTRVILLHGYSGPYAAGHVIESFGHFVVGGSYTVGLVVFAIFIIINFVVITKGATRIAEVGARFTLDAMPGKQMAIDADLNAGMIGEDEARKRRSEVALEADFFGAMDGASKFVRGDAIAAIMILVINIIGGLVIGIVQHHMSPGAAASRYTLLTIGDGLVAQIPALVISTAAGLVVSRVNHEDLDLSRQVVGQLLRRPGVIAIVAAILITLGIIPGMPHLVFLGIGGLIGYYAWRRMQGAESSAVKSEALVENEAVIESESGDVTWADIEPVDPLSLEVGYRLIPMVDSQQKGDLLARIRATRRKYAQELGFLIPPVHVRDNLELRPNGYRILLKDVEVASGEIFPDLLLAIDPGSATAELSGAATRDPAFDLRAVWIDTEQREQAQTGGYTVVDAATVVATHLGQLFEQHADELLGQSEVDALLDRLHQQIPKLADELGKKLPLVVILGVLRHLLEEDVPIRDMRTVAETLLVNAGRTQDPAMLAEAVRRRLGPFIVQRLYGNANELGVAALAPNMEKLLSDQVQVGDSSEESALEPGLVERLLREAQHVMQALEASGLPAVLVTNQRLRPLLARLVVRAAKRLRVLSYEEIPDTKSIRVVVTLGGE